MSIYLSFFLYNVICRIPSPFRVLLIAVGISPNDESLSSLFEHGFSVLDIKPLMKAANLPLVM